jgi:aminopeptidase-like protein
MLQENLKIAELNLLAHKTNYLQYVEAQYTSICDRLDHRTQEIMLTAEERAADNVVYARNPELKGPLGSSYLKKQLGPETDLSALQLMQRGSLIGYEVLSFVDGQNSVLDIRNAVSAEYMPVPLEEVKNFLALLDEAGVIKQTGNN